MFLKAVTACGLCEAMYQFDIANVMFPEMYAYVSTAYDVLEMLFR